MGVSRLDPRFLEPTDGRWGGWVSGTVIDSVTVCSHGGAVGRGVRIIKRVGGAVTGI